MYLKTSERIGQVTPVAATTFAYPTGLGQPGTNLQEIKDTTMVPFRLICHLIPTVDHPDTGREVQVGGGATGFLVGSRYVLTVAHNVYGPLRIRRGKTIQVVWQEVKRFTVIPGRNGNQSPFGQVTSAAFAYPSRWRTHREVRFDYALIKLDTRIGLKRFAAIGNKRLGWWGSGEGTVIKSIDYPELKEWKKSGQELRLSGYPGAEGKQWYGRGAMRDLPPKCGGSEIPGLISYLIDGEEGHSGSPLWLYFAHNNKERLLVGIHRGGCEPECEGCTTNRSYSLGVLFTSSVRTQINDWIKDMEKGELPDTVTDRV